MADVKLYLSGAAAGYVPATIRGAWDITTQASTFKCSTTRDGAGSPNGQYRYAYNTNADNDVLAFRSISIPLSAVELSGVWTGCLGIYESNAAMNAQVHIYAYVTTGDSDTPRGTLINTYIDADEVSVAAATGGEGLGGTGSAVSVSLNDRICIEIGYRANAASIYACYVYTGGSNGTDLSDGENATLYPGWFSFAESSGLSSGGMPIFFDLS